jgi:hypothetical protein
MRSDMAPSQDEIQIVTDAMLAESSKWGRLSDDFTGFKQATANLNLEPSAFFVGNPVTSRPASSAYRELQDLVVNLLGEAAAEVDQISDALKRAVDLYETTDGKVAADVSKIYGP